MAEELVGGCISKKIWDQMCANTLDLENATVEEIEAGLDPDFVPEGRLDPPTPPKKLMLSLAKKTECTSELSALKASRFATPVSKSMKLQKEWCQLLNYPKLCSIFPNWISSLDMLTHCEVWYLE